MAEQLPEFAASETQAKQIALAAAKILDAKKAYDVKLLHVTKQTILADFFVIAGGSSSTQVNALSDEVEFQLGEKGLVPTRTEGKGSGKWVLLDYGSVLVHVFNRETRDFYKLERLWADGTEIPFLQE